MNAVSPQLDAHIQALKEGKADPRTLAIFKYFGTLRTEQQAAAQGRHAKASVLTKQRLDAFRDAVHFTMDELNAWKDTPISEIAQCTELRKDYRQFPIDTTHPRFQDGYVDVRDLGIAGHNFYYECDETTYPYHTKIDGTVPHLLVRETVGHYLLIADAMLEKVGLGVYVLDTWRPGSVQAGLYKWFEDYLKKKTPDLEGEALQKAVQKFVSLPPAPGEADPLSPPPHMTGGAVDFILINRKTGQPLSTGVQFDEFTDMAAPDYLEKKRLRLEAEGKTLTDSETDALKNIRLAYHMMTSLGFVALDSENWHFELYTQYWAKANGLQAGFYGTMEPDLDLYKDRPWVKKNDSMSTDFCAAAGGFPKRSADSKPLQAKPSAHTENPHPYK